MAIDLGNAPVGTPPTAGEKAQILSVIGGNLTSGPVTSLNGLSNITDASVSVAKLSGGFGTGVLSALTKNIGTNGSPQLYGEAMAPTAIKVPDMTGLIPDAGYIGLNGGLLSVGDGVAVGGKVVAKRRIFGTKIINTDGSNRASSFWKVFGIPLTAAEFTSGRTFDLKGSIYVASPNGSGGDTITNITRMVFGTCFLGGAGTAYSTTGGAGPTKWNAVGFAPLANWSSNSPIRFDILPIQNLSGYLANFTMARSQIGGSSAVLSNRNPDGGATATSGVANEICFMLQIDTSGTGSRFMEGEVSVSYDLTLDFTN